MGEVKYQMNSINKDSSPLVAISGGFIYVNIDGNIVCTVSVPIPDYMSNDRHRDNISAWDEEFHDDDGHTYVATVYSSMNGIEWEISIESDIDGVEKVSEETVRDISSRITTELHLSEDG